jgi:hypothetical protein
MSCTISLSVLPPSSASLICFFPYPDSISILYRFVVVYPDNTARGSARWSVEHLLSAMEALGVDNCRVDVSGGTRSVDVCSVATSFQLPTAN